MAIKRGYARSSENSRLDIAQYMANVSGEYPSLNAPAHIIEMSHHHIYVYVKGESIEVCEKAGEMLMAYE